MSNIYTLNLNTLKMKKLVLLCFVTLLFACNNQPQNEKSSNEPNQQQATTEADNSNVGRKNFAVVWKWKTTDKKIFEENNITISREMEELWKKDVIVDAYFDNDTKIYKSGYFPNISCFLKAKSEEEAKTILNKLTLVEKEMAEYTIYPVGAKWLGRATEAINKRGFTKSYVAVWSTSGKVSLNDDRDVIKAQSDALMKLWNEGAIENVYFDVEGTQKNNNVTDFVFFVNADSEKEAIEVCDNLPFVKEKIATYKLQPVGIFWLGEFKNQQ